MNESLMHRVLAAAGVGASGLDTRGRSKSEAQALESVDLLLDAGADVKDCDSTGLTALHGAASLGWNTVITRLAESRADLFAKDSRGRTAADLTRAEVNTAGGRASGAVARPETEALLRQLMAAAAPTAATLAPAAPAVP